MRDGEIVPADARLAWAAGLESFAAEALVLPRVAHCALGGEFLQRSSFQPDD